MSPEVAVFWYIFYIYNYTDVLGGSAISIYREMGTETRDATKTVVESDPKKKQGMGKYCNLPDATIKESIRCSPS
jgi:hypothetical protein